LSTCCGGIFGIGETDQDIVDLADTYRELGVDSIPMNFLIPIPGTPLANNKQLTPQKCLKIIALFRLFNPKAGYLTRAGRPPGKDEEMIKRLGRKLITKKESFSFRKTVV